MLCFVLEERLRFQGSQDAERWGFEGIPPRDDRVAVTRGAMRDVEELRVEKLRDQGVPVYRAFRLRADGKVCPAEMLIARSDAEAQALAAAMTNLHGIELWERARFLGRYAPRD